MTMGGTHERTVHGPVGDVIGYNGRCYGLRDDV